MGGSGVVAPKDRLKEFERKNHGLRGQDHNETLKLGSVFLILIGRSMGPTRSDCKGALQFLG